MQPNNAPRALCHLSEVVQGEPPFLATGTVFLNSDPAGDPLQCLAVEVCPLPESWATVNADIALLTQASERSFELRQRLIDLFDSGAQLFRVESEVFAAGEASGIRVALYACDGLLELVAAVRAGEFDAL